MDVVPSELITGRWKLNSSVCTIMCFGHIDSAAVCFNEGRTTTTSRSARGLQSSFLSAKRLHVRQMLILFFFFFLAFLILPDSDGRLPGDADRCGDPRANCGMCVPRLGPQGH